MKTDSSFQVYPETTAGHDWGDNRLGTIRELDRCIHHRRRRVDVGPRWSPITELSIDDGQVAADLVLAKLDRETGEPIWWTELPVLTDSTIEIASLSQR